MTILPNSPLGATANIYLSETRDRRLFFKHDRERIDTLLIKKSNGDYWVETVSTLVGQPNGSTGEAWDYRWDFEPFISIEGPRLETLDRTDPYFWSIRANGIDEIHFVIGNTGLLDTNITDNKIVRLSDGRLKLLVSPAALIGEGGQNYNFIDRSQGPDLFLPLPVRASKNTFTLWGTGVLYWSQRSLSGVISSGSISNTSNSDYVIGIINTPLECTRIDFELIVGSTSVLSTTINTVLSCGNPWWCQSESGEFLKIDMQGQLKPITTTERNDIIIGSTLVRSELIIKNSIKQNTGIGLTNAQLSALVKSPIVYQIGATGVKEWQNGFSQWESYNGVTLGKRNIELVFTDPVTTKRTHTKNIGFWE